jgi:hypothetical protein
VASDGIENLKRVTEIADAVAASQWGEADLNRISTTHVERQNLTMWMQIRRFTRLTKAFSKKCENHYAALALYFADYNFVRIHSSICVTPAMEAGLTDDVWTLKELMVA